MPEKERQPDDAELAEMHRILRKVAAHDIPTAEEIEFLRGVKIEVLEWFTGPSVRLDSPA